MGEIREDVQLATPKFLEVVWEMGKNYHRNFQKMNGFLFGGRAGCQILPSSAPVLPRKKQIHFFHLGRCKFSLLTFRHPWGISVSFHPFQQVGSGLEPYKMLIGYIPKHSSVTNQCRFRTGGVGHRVMCTAVLKSSAPLGNR